MPTELNPAQREAVHTLTGPLLVLAGAGTGKTRVVTYRIAELIKSGVPPEGILGVTFTNKAAGEMRHRALELLGKRRTGRPEISTFHSFCVRVLRRQIRHLGYPEAFAIYDRGDQEGVARSVLRDLKVPGAELKPSDLIHQISRWRTAGVTPQQASTLAKDDTGHLAAMGYRRYQQALRLCGAVDFDDLLALTEEVLARFPEVRKQESSRFCHLLIDEYQDTNGAQYRIVKHLATPHRNLCVVGDDDQSIYGWRGAEVTHILQFQRDWPDAKVIRLEENYRSTGSILGLANRLIVFNSRRHDKVLRTLRVEGELPRVLHCPDEAAEAKHVIEEIRAAVFGRRAQPRDFAILFRTNEQPRPFEQELRRVKVPYTLIGGMSFFDRKEVRDVVAFLKLLSHPQDEVALLRVINVPPRGIGPKAVERIVAEAVRRGVPSWEVLAEASGLGGAAAAAGESIRGFVNLIEKHRQLLKENSLVDAAAGLIHAVGYQAELDRLYPEPQERQARWNAVEEVVNALGAYCQRESGATLAGFLDDLTLSTREDADDKEARLAKDAVALMTIHSAKGLEFPQVYLVGMEDGILPHARALATGVNAIDEERRLCYVGVTRAQDKLTLSLALNRTRWGKLRPTTPSRFLFELTGKAERPPAKEARRNTPPTSRRSTGLPPKRS